MNDKLSGHRPDHDLHGSRPDDDLTAQIAANPELSRLAHVLKSGPTERELTGLDSAIVAFRSVHVSSPSTKTRRRFSMITTLTGAKLGASLAALAVGAGGVATAAYVSTNVAATPTSQSTHSTAAASATEASDATSKAGDKATGAVGPDATGKAAYGLCTAWKGAADSGKAMDSVAFRNLTTAAGGEDKVEAFCAAVEAPGKAADHATNKPTDVPTGKPADAPTGKPSEAPSGKPADVPTPTKPTEAETHPTGRP